MKHCNITKQLGLFYNYNCNQKQQELQGCILYLICVIFASNQ